jgi:prevent-host-death family protein
MKLVNIQAAKTHLSRLVEEAAAGEEIVLAKAGRPYVKLVPCMPSATPRKLGGWENVRIPADFDDVDSEMVRLFEGVDAPHARRTRKSKAKS